MFPLSLEVNNLELRQVIKSVNVLNCCLIALALLFAYSLLFPQLDSNGTNVLPPLKKKPAEKTPSEPLKAQNPSPMDYVVIADENLFHPERRIPPEKKDEAALPKPEFVLFGTLLTPQLTMAYLEDKKAPVTTPGRGKRQTALKKGESLSGFTLKEILADKVVMTRGEETLTVLLNDTQSPKTREAAGTPSPQTQIPGVPGTGSSSPAAAGQPPTQPVPGRQGAFPAAGLPTSPSTTPPGVGPTPQSSATSGITPVTPSVSQPFPSRRQRYMQSMP
jgi:hypothetical protein